MVEIEIISAQHMKKKTRKGRYYDKYHTKAVFFQVYTQVKEAVSPCD